jgi:hypothetical protein
MLSPHRYRLFRNSWAILPQKSVDSLMARLQRDDKPLARTLAPYYQWAIAQAREILRALPVGLAVGESETGETALTIPELYAQGALDSGLPPFRPLTGYSWGLYDEGAVLQRDDGRLYVRSRPARGGWVSGHPDYSVTLDTWAEPEGSVRALPADLLPLALASIAEVREKDARIAVPGYNRVRAEGLLAELRSPTGRKALRARLARVGVVVPLDLDRATIAFDYSHISIPYRPRPYEAAAKAA